MGIKSLIVFLGFLGFLWIPKAEAQCLKHSIKYTQKEDQYHWTMEWESTKPFADYEKYFSDSAGEVLEGRSEVVQNMWWKQTDSASGNLEAWIMVDTGFSKSKKYFLRKCKTDVDYVFCQLDTNAGGAGDRIKWAWSKVYCTKNEENTTPETPSYKCSYDDSGAIKGVMGFASAQTISVGINTQSMKDVLRLAIASELGINAVKVGFGNSRKSADSFWGQGQDKIKRGEKSFTVKSSNNCD